MAPVPQGPVSGGSDLSRRTRPRYSTAGNHPIIREPVPRRKKRGTDLLIQLFDKESGNNLIWYDPESSAANAPECAKY